MNCCQRYIGKLTSKIAIPLGVCCCQYIQDNLQDILKQKIPKLKKTEKEKEDEKI